MLAIDDGQEWETRQGQRTFDALCDDAKEMKTGVSLLLTMLDVASTAGVKQT